MKKYLLVASLLLGTVLLMAQTPTITSFTPTSAAAGATVTITGTNFTGATAVSFGGTAASSFSVVSATSIAAVVASGTTGTVSVTTPGGTATSTGTFTFLVAPGNALALDGVDDFVDAGNDASVQIYTGTIEAWIKTSDAGSGFRGIVVKQWAFGMFLKDNVLIAFSWDGSQGISTGINLADNRWHHVAFCFANGVANGSFVYIDGALTSTTTHNINDQDVGLAIGNGATNINDDQTFQGSIDEVRVWNTVRTQAEIQSNLYTELAGNESNLVAYYNCNQGVAGGDNTGITTLNNLSSQANQGTLTNFDQTGPTSNFVESYAMVVPVPATATNLTGTSFTANWTAPAVGTVTSYKLDVSTSSTFGSFVTGYNGLDCGTSLSQAVSGLTGGSTYYYRVRANKTSVTGTGGYYRTPITVTTSSCANPTSGGNISGTQTICSGFVPAAFTSPAAASGQAGTLEYKWQVSTTSGTSGFADYTSGTYTSTTLSFGTATLTVTSWFKRLARVGCISDWTGAAESNALQVTVNQPSYSGSHTIADLQAGTGSSTISWYANASGGTPLAASTALVNGHHYYASQTVNGVESTARLDVTASLDLTPCKPTGASSQTPGSPYTVAQLSASGQNIRWYAASSGGNALDPATPLVNGTTYYATQTISCTESASRLAVTVTLIF